METLTEIILDLIVHVTVIAAIVGVGYWVLTRVGDKKFDKWREDCSERADVLEGVQRDHIHDIASIKRRLQSLEDDSIIRGVAQAKADPAKECVTREELDQVRKLAERARRLCIDCKGVEYWGTVGRTGRGTLSDIFGDRS